MKSATCIFALLALVGCDQPPAWDTRPVPVYAGKDLPEACLISLDAALAFWADLGVDYLELREYKDVISYGILVTHRDLAGDVIGQYSRPPGLDVGIVTADLCNGMVGLQVMSHEFGHALGLGHSPYADHLMYPFISLKADNFKVSEEELDQVR